MSENYSRELMRIAVAQICQTIGYNATQSASLELLQDTMHKFMQEFARDLRRQTEHYNRTETNLNDVWLTLDSLDISVGELLEYMNNVEPVPPAIEIPKYPAYKSSNLNFLKPGSQEVLTRPVHIYEYLPPILPPEPNSSPVSTAPHYRLNGGSQDKADAGGEGSTASASEDALFSGVNAANKSHHSSMYEPGVGGATNSSKWCTEKESLTPYVKSATATPGFLDEEGRPTREIRSVVMTTGGFISPAIEGKLPDAIIPEAIEKLQGFDAPRPSPATVPSRPSSRTSAEAPQSATSNKNIDLDMKPSTSQSKTMESVAKAKSSGLSEVIMSSSAALVAGGTGRTGQTAGVGSATHNPAKKHHGTHNAQIHSQQTPTMASRLLKKAKKKTPNSPLSGQGKQSRLESSSFVQSGSNAGNASIASDKAQRKSQKMLQKLSKSAKANQSLGYNSEAPSTDEKTEAYINPAVLAAMPPGLGRAKIEKLLKKQNKHKQKQHKQHMTKASAKVRQSNAPLEPALFTPEIIYPKQTVIPDSPITPFGVSPTKEGKGTKGTRDMEANALATTPPKLSHQYPVLPNSKPLGVNLQAMGENQNELAQRSPDNMERKLVDHVEIKLSTEPDRSKLNIFKKISKQKGSKVVSPNMSRMQPTPIICSENQVINLPSGTTITPAPPAVTVARSIYSRDSADVVNLGDFTEGTGNVSGRLGDGAVSAGSGLSSADVSFVDDGATGSSNKPKKRGRKPGSKNHAKASGMPVSAQKKSKKMKMDKGAYMPNFLASADAATEPLNLTHSNQFAGAGEYDQKFVNLPTLPAIDPSNPQQTSVCDRKERKKKTKNATPSVAIAEQSIAKDTSSVPTREEVNSINKKLMRMDTVLKPAPPIPTLLKLHDLANPMVEQPKDSMHSPNMASTSAKSPGSKKRALQRIPPMVMPPTMAPLFPTGAPGYPNLQGPMLPMLSLYPFPSGPGLIPPPNPFHTPMNGFPNSSKMPALPNIMMPPNFLGLGLRKALGPDSDSDNKGDMSADLIPQASDRSYCNVAPLVPDSMKLTPPDMKIEKHLTHTQTEHDSPKTSRNRHSSPAPSELLTEHFFKKQDSLGTADSTNVASKTIPATTGSGISLSSYETLVRKNSNRAEISSSTDSSAHLQTTSSGNADDPIEVSDDSVDSPPKTIPSADASAYTGKSKSGHGFSANIDDIFTPHAVLGRTKAESASKEAKKQKKSNKLAKKQSSLFNPSISAAATGPMDVFSGEKAGVGKLAGGADLIPLAGTGLAYSSKTIPSTSLTAASASSFPVHKRDVVPPNIFNNLTITPSPSMQATKSRKEHKKLKKIKEGKIKKKKDKKDKAKSKERAEKHLHKAEKALKQAGELEKHKEKDKERLKRLKKEKKKIKQRMTMDLSDSIVATPSQTNYSSEIDVGGYEKLQLLLQPSIITSTVAPDSTTHAAAAVVPKLTLKLASCQSPTPLEDAHNRFSANLKTQTHERDKRDLSPELARISPLVTRPPKQKSSSHEGSMSGLGGSPAAASGSHNDTIGDMSKTTTASTVVQAANALILPPRPWLAGGTLAASAVLLPQQLMQNTKAQDHAHIGASSSGASASESATASIAAATAPATARSTALAADRQSPVTLISEASRPSSYIDAEGNRVWICPACGKVDDGSAMIGCDGCDAWYHWVCVGIVVAPKDNEDWFCRVCITKKKGVHGSDKKRKRSKKK